VFFLFLFFLAVAGAWGQITYTFSTELSAAGNSIPGAINRIKENANGSDVIIVFDNFNAGSSTLVFTNSGTYDGINFSSTPQWGAITLSSTLGRDDPNRRIIAASAETVLYLASDVSVMVNNITIDNTANGHAIYLKDEASLTIHHGRNEQPNSEGNRDRHWIRTNGAYSIYNDGIGTITLTRTALDGTPGGNGPLIPGKIRIPVGGDEYLFVPFYDSQISDIDFRPSNNARYTLEFVPYDNQSFPVTVCRNTGSRSNMFAIAADSPNNCWTMSHVSSTHVLNGNCNITFDLKAGGVANPPINPVVVGYGPVPTTQKPDMSTITRPGYLDDGNGNWYTDPDTDTEFTFGTIGTGTIVTTNIALSPKWRAANIEGINLENLSNTGTFGQAYSGTISPIIEGNAGGNVTYTITDGNLPDGLSLNGNTISGRPTKIGPFNFKIKADHANGKTFTTGAIQITINKAQLHDDMIAYISSQPYTGTGIQPSITVTDGDPNLITASDYEISYSNNIDVGTTAKVTITATPSGNYIDKAERNFEITKINQGPLVVSGITKTYGEAAFQLSVTGGSSGETITYERISGADAVATVTAGGTVSINGVGYITVRATRPGGKNYNDVTADFTITVNPKPITINNITHTKIYDGNTNTGAINLNTVTLNGVEAGDDGNVQATSIAANYTSPNAGTTTVNVSNITLGGTRANNYSIAPQNGVTVLGGITPRPITIVANDKYIFIGASEPLYTYIVTGNTLVAPEDISSPPSYALDRTFDNTVAGTFTITPSGAGASSNYSVSYESGTLHISNLIQIDDNDIIFDDVSVDYDGTAKSLTAIYNSSSNNFTYDYVGTLRGGGSYHSQNPPTDAGTYTVTAIYIDATHMGFKEATLTINPKTISISTLSHTKIYDGNTTVYVTNPAGAVTFSDVVSTPIDDTPNVQATSITANYTSPNANTTTINITGITIGGTKAHNYVVAMPQNGVTVAGITRKPIAAEMFDITPPIYTGSPITLTTTDIVATDGSLTVQFTIGTYAGNTNAGTNTASVSVTGAGNYQGTLTLPFSISKAAINKPSLEQSVFGYNGSAHAVSLNETGPYAFSGDVARTNANSYTAIVSLNDKNNYEWKDGTNTDLELSWSISRRAITTVTIAGVTAPAINGIPTQTATASTDYPGLVSANVSVVWSPDHATFQSGTPYTASVTLTANNNHTFDGLIKANFNGEISGTDILISGTSNATVKLSRTFAAIEEVEVIGISIAAQPTKLAYTHGDALDLAGLEVTLIYSNGTTKNVLFEDFEDNNITTKLENGTILSRKDHNGKPVTVIYNVLNITDDTSLLMVESKKIIPPTLLQSSFTFDGTEKTISLNETGPYTLSGDITKTNAGSYTAVVGLNDKDNYEWASGTSNDLALTWNIKEVLAEISGITIDEKTTNEKIATHIGNNTLEVFTACNLDIATITVQTNPIVEVKIEGVQGNSRKVNLDKFGDNFFKIEVTAPNGNSQNYTLKINKPIPFNQLVVLRWDNTLTVINNPKNNGGFTFNEYAWFRNGEKTKSGQSWEFNTSSSPFNPSDLYYVEVVSNELDGVLRSCESYVELRNTTSIRSKDYEQLDLENAVLEIYDMAGRRIAVQPAQDPIPRMYLGFHVFVIRDKNGFRRKMQ
jgi:hypothetical protein